MIVQQTWMKFDHINYRCMFQTPYEINLDGAWDQWCFLDDQDFFIASCIFIITICSQNFNHSSVVIAELTIQPIFLPSDDITTCHV